MDFAHLLAILAASIFTSNILLTNYLGMCSFLSVSKDLRTAVGLGVAVTFVLAFTSAINWIVYKQILVPFNLEWMSFIVFIVIIASFVQILEMIIERVSENLYNALGIFLPLITVNCAILGVSLFMVIRDYSFIASFVFGTGSGIGWLLAITAMAGMRERLKTSKIPPGLEGAGIALIITGIMALAFTGFSGMIPL